MTRKEIEAALAECEGHTPGEWISDMGDIKGEKDGVNGGIIATVWGRITPKTTAANIAIVSLAPALASALREAWGEIDRLKGSIVKTKRFEQGNCPICGYNGPGYFQPDKHPCAKYYHRDYPLDEALNAGDGSYKP
jgi:hypothetical protein